MNVFTENLNEWVWTVGLLGGALVLGLLVNYMLFKVVETISKKTQTVFDDAFIKHCRGASRIVFLLFTAHFVIPFLNISQFLTSFLSQLTRIMLIASVSWLLIKMTSVVEDLILSMYQVDTKDNLRARRVYTQIHLFKRICIIIIGIIAFASILMTFERLRQFGTSILASAGVIGIIIGFAAQRSIATVFAGLQIAIAQPIRIDDVVIVENEWGRIEEITLTNVVVRIWDSRRLILPITYFIEKPFQNWTRVSADILGTVFLYVDYTVPVQAIRQELTHILENNENWDRRVSGLVVTNAMEHAMELRALMSAEDASKAWDLRCEVREKLIDFVQKNYPDSLPKLRTEIKDAAKSKIVSRTSDNKDTK